MNCSNPGCTEPASTKGMCRRHYQAVWYLENRERVLPRMKTYQAANLATKREQDRLRRLDPEFRAKERAKLRIWYEAHREEIKVKNATRYQADKPRRAALERMKKYQLDQAGFDSLLVSQDNRCAICRSDVPGGRGGFAVDHCHETGEVRGLLCTNCNNGLGRFQDDPERLIAAAAYLQRFGR